ncbi:thioester reductase domain-containing protein [Acetivibrio clariflavus]|uniref:Thioester reductase-like protein n=1 Tax=Acetivibrio clariflavus (strain DSM 19732 / NBRC 101661 / EBR45) TaxID=720554 RepID=G8M265_ACECE|nr:thioester reductase domain-containing protein [Acetivibrio clariflavus]AEV69224.1 thioester reductase-like protein [Acetivibrio clariflavus DSM 19732]
MAIKLLNVNSGKTNACSEQKVNIKEVSTKEIAIIGMAGKFPMAENGLDEFWTNIRNGKDCITEFPESRKRDTDSFIKFVGMDESNISYIEGGYLESIDKFDYNFFQLSPNEASLMDPHQRLFLETIYAAIEDAGYGGKRIRGSRTGVYLGYYDDDFTYKQAISYIAPSLYSMSIPGNISAIIASRVSYLLDLKGPSMLINTTCSSSLVAIHLACQAIRNGECDMAIAGGVKINLLPVVFKNIKDIGIRSSDNRTHTFDDNSDGTGWGEGVAAIMLKSLSKAIDDGDNIYAVIKGSAINQDGSSIGITAPNPNAQMDVIIRAWKDAGIEPESISYIEAHGTGTKLGDPIEIEGISKAFSKYSTAKQFCAIGSVKSNIGHLDNMAGLAGVIKSVLSLKNEEIPPTINFSRPNRNIDFVNSPVFVIDKILEWKREEGKVRRCGVSSFGLSGTNCHLILEEAPQRLYVQEQQDDKMQVLVLSAKNMNVLKNIVKKYRDYLGEKGDIKRICYTANTGREHYNCRLAMVIKNFDDLKKKLENLLNLDVSLNADVKITEGVYIGETERSNSENIVENIGEIERIKKLNMEASSKIREYIESGESNIELLYDICKLYVKGANIDFDELYRNEKIIKVSLPTYPFERIRCWLDKVSLNVGKQKIILKGKEGGEYSEIEKNIACVWAEVLGLEEININESFFELGGNSINAIEVLAKLRDKYDVSMNNIFEHPTIYSLAQNISLKNDSVKLRIEQIKELLLNNLNQRNEELPETEGYNQRLAKCNEIDLDKKKKYENILLTGATGFLGSYLLRDLLINTDSVIYILIRGKDYEEAKRKCESKFSYYFDEDLIAKYNERVVIVNGDLRYDRFGLDIELYDKLSRKIDCIIHSAAIVKHYGIYSEFYEINVKGTERLLKFSQTGRDKDFNHISTTGIAFANIEGRERVLFTEYDFDFGQKLTNVYAQTKFLAEEMVYKARENGLNANIFRIGNIVGDSKTGVFQLNIEENAVYSLLRSLIKLDYVPNWHYNNMEISFIDYISKAIVLLFNRLGIMNHTHHIYNPNLVNINNLSEVFSHLGYNKKSMQLVDYLDYLYDVYRNNENKTLKKMVEVMFLHLGIFDEELSRTEIILRCDKTSLILSKLGFEWPEINDEHIKIMIDYCKKVNFI